MNIAPKAIVTEEQAYQALRLAQVQAELCGPNPRAMPGSAKARAEDAAACFARGDWWGTANAALDSLAYSAGKFSTVFRSAKESFQ